MLAHSCNKSERQQLFLHCRHMLTLLYLIVMNRCPRTLCKATNTPPAISISCVLTQDVTRLLLASRLAKERSAEDHLFGDKEKFVTAAYKKKLEEEKQWLAEEKLREAQEQKNDVVKKGHMGDFYMCGSPSLSLCLQTSVPVASVHARENPAPRDTSVQVSLVHSSVQHLTL